MRGKSTPFVVIETFSISRIAAMLRTRWNLRTVGSPPVRWHAFDAGRHDANRLLNFFNPQNIEIGELLHSLFGHAVHAAEITVVNDIRR